MQIMYAYISNINSGISMKHIILSQQTVLTNVPDLEVDGQRPLGHECVVAGVSSQSFDASMGTA